MHIHMKISRDLRYKLNYKQLNTVFRNKQKTKDYTTYMLPVSGCLLSVALTLLLVSVGSSPTAGVTGSYQLLVFTEVYPPHRGHYSTSSLRKQKPTDFFLYLSTSLYSPPPARRSQATHRIQGDCSFFL